MREFLCDSASISFVAWSTHIPHQDGAIFSGRDLHNAFAFNHQSHYNILSAFLGSSVLSIFYPFFHGLFREFILFHVLSNRANCSMALARILSSFSSLTLTVYHFLFLLHDRKGTLLGRRQMSAISSWGIGICHKYKSNWGHYGVSYASVTFTNFLISLSSSFKVSEYDNTVVHDLIDGGNFKSLVLISSLCNGCEVTSKTRSSLW